MHLVEPAKYFRLMYFAAVQCVGDLRNLIAVGLQVPLGRVYLCCGSVMDDDSVMLGQYDSSGTGRLACMSYLEDTDELCNARDKLQAQTVSSAPDTILSSNDTFCGQLMYLLDVAGSESDVDLAAFRVLSNLQSSPSLNSLLKEACQPDIEHTAVTLSFPLLLLPESMGSMNHKRPGALLYTLEVLHALMEPWNQIVTGARFCQSIEHYGTL